MTKTRHRFVAKKRVLIVDDEPCLRSIYSRILTKSGYEVVPASTGQQALEIFRSAGTFDLIISDIAMPGIQGTDLVHVFRGLSPDTPVILMSCFHNAQVPGDFFLRKPFRADELKSAVNRILSSRSHSRSDVSRAIDRVKQMLHKSECLICDALRSGRHANEVMDNLITLLDHMTHAQ